MIIFALAVPAVVATGVLPLLPADAVAEESTDAAAAAQDAEQKSLPSTPETDVQGAPAEAGGEPFRLCEACHPDYLEKPSQTGDLIFSHPIHVDQDIKCATCHEPPLGHFSAPAPMMMSCLSCHEGETAPNECKNCHRKIDEIAPGLDEAAVHLEPDAKSRHTCEKCHDVEVWCEQCHGVEMPHPANWQARHSEVAKSSAEDCEKCHQSRDKTFCIRCHGVEMPHPAYWYSTHGDIARVGSQSCDTCHPAAPDFCDTCHHAGYRAETPWATGHGEAVDSAGTDRCFVCHEQDFCERCHETGEYPEN
jgi:hypothetical protein